MSAGIRIRLAILFVVLGTLVPARFASAQISDAWLKRWQQNAPNASATPTGPLPPRQPAPPAKVIPREWKLAGASIFALAAGIVIIVSIRAWRSANVFGRRFRFRSTTAGATRLGADRCGGHLATIHFGTRSPRN